MKINQTKTHTTRNILIVILILIVLAGGYLLAAHQKTWWPFSSAPTPTSTIDNNSDSNQNSTTKNSGSTNSENQTPTQSNSQTPVQSTDQNGNDSSSASSGNSTSNNLNVVINQANVSGGTLSIRVTIDQLLGSGTCTLTAGNYTATADVVANPQSSSCQGFDVPTSQISGHSFTVKVVSGQKSGSASGTF
ncbi:MAG: hypothetical protein LBM73_01435 [Candidatus Nomurabacteria bacterium]|jgi:hypothetical protein|nr:hypothetical protein [Candidatus Nomurabacteria bacterium]